MKEKKFCRRGACASWLTILSLCFGAFNFADSVHANNGDKQPPPRPAARLVTTVRGTNARPARSASSEPESATAVSNTTASARRAFVATPTSAEQQAFELLNAARHANNLPPLQWDGELCYIARLHSSDMAKTGVLDHKGSDGLDPAGRARSCGVGGWRALGENIGYNQGFDDPAAFAVERWLQSTKHRANILNDTFTHTGIGVAQSPDGSVYFTQVFVAR